MADAGRLLRSHLGRLGCGTCCLRCVGLVWCGAHAGLWQDDVFTETVVWFTTTGLVLWANAHRVTEQRRFVPQTLAQIVGLTVFIEGFVNIYVFALPIELVLVPLLTVLVMTTALAESAARLASVAKLGNVLLVGIGLVLLGCVAIRLAVGFGSVDWAHIGRLLMLPVWLGLGVLPAIYALGVYMAYDNAYRRINLFAENTECGKGARRRAKLALVLGTHLRARAAAGLSGWIGRPSPRPELSQFNDARQIVAAEVAGQREEEAFAGCDGRGRLTPTAIACRVA